MFVKDFKKLSSTIKPISFSSSIKMFEWNENTENLEEVEVNTQELIDEFKGMDLKSMIERNIKPVSEKPVVYGDTTVYSNGDIHGLYNALTNDVILEPDVGEVPKNDGAEVPKNDAAEVPKADTNKDERKE